jgi:hypothetical protein
MKMAGINAKSIGTPGSKFIKQLILLPEEYLPPMV